MHGLLATTFFAGPNGHRERTHCRADRDERQNKRPRSGQSHQCSHRTNPSARNPQRRRWRTGRCRSGNAWNPGKYTFCFAEREDDSPWESLAVERGFSPDASTVSLFAASGVTPIMDQASRDPDALCRSFAACLKANGHPKHANTSPPVLVISPEHTRRYGDAGWSKARFRETLNSYLEIPVEELVSGAGDIPDGISPKRVGDQKTMPKFRANTLHIVRAGGDAGLFSAIIGSWGGSQSVTREITS